MFAVMVRNRDYKQAQRLIDTVQLNEQVSIEYDHLGNFRKYLRELVSKQDLPHQFATRIQENNKLKVIRIT